MSKYEHLKDEFCAIYGGKMSEIHLFTAPGRVNLIGEHTDYNGGLVFPAALTFGTTMLVRKREDRMIRLASRNFSQQVTRDLSDLSYREVDDWANYPKAMLVHLQQHGFTCGGMDVLFDGEIPNGAGLSSSASLLVVSGYGFLKLAGYEPNKKQLALIAQEAENIYMGVNCGIMDQFAVAMGKQNHAIMLTCDTLDYEYVPFEADGYRLIISNTNKRRGLVDSAYNLRRSQCEQAVNILKQAFPSLQQLAELKPTELESNLHLFTDIEVKKRAQHVIYENERVLYSVEALQNNDLHQFGKLMIQSHESLRDLYEVSCEELDVMVEEALKIAGVLGSRMTGAGFGGCTVSLVEQTKVDAFIRKVGAAYKQRTSLEADFYVAEIGEGVRKLEEELK